MNSLLEHWFAVGPTKSQQRPRLCSNLCQRQRPHGNKAPAQSWKMVSDMFTIKTQKWSPCVRTTGMKEGRVDMISPLLLTAEIVDWICSTSQHLLWACIYEYTFPHRCQPPPRGPKLPMYVYPRHFNITFLKNYRRTGDQMPLLCHRLCQSTSWEHLVGGGGEQEVPVRIRLQLCNKTYMSGLSLELGIPKDQPVTPTAIATGTVS